MIKLKKINVEVFLLKQMLEAQGMSFEEIKESKELLGYIKKTAGVDLQALDVPETQEVNVDPEKIIAYDTEVIELPGCGGLKGFSVWFGTGKGDTWCFSEEDHQKLDDYFLTKL